MKALGPLEVRDRGEQISGLRIPLQTEHPHETLGGRLSPLTEFLETVGSVDVIAENCLAGVQISGDEAGLVLSGRRFSAPSVREEGPSPIFSVPCACRVPFPAKEPGTRTRGGAVCRRRPRD